MKMFETFLNYLNGVPTTGWVLFAGSAVLIFTASFFVAKAIKKDKKRKLELSKIISKQPETLNLELTEKDRAWLKTQYDRHIKEGRHLVFVKGTNVRW